MNIQVIPHRVVSCWGFHGAGISNLRKWTWSANTLSLGYRLRLHFGFLLVFSFWFVFVVVVVVVWIQFLCLALARWCHTHSLLTSFFSVFPLELYNSASINSIFLILIFLVNSKQFLILYAIISIWLKQYVFINRLHKTEIN